MTDLSEDQIKELLPLANLITQIVRETPIRLGPGGTDDLVAQLTVKTCVWIGKNVLPYATPSVIESAKGDPS